MSEREEFEKWCKTTRPVINTCKSSFGGKTYSHDSTKAAWRAWQAARKK